MARRLRIPGAMRIHSLILGAALAAFLGATAEAKQTKYVGVHPISSGQGGGFCYLEVPHVHVYVPAKSEVLYREHDGGHFFVGDPVPYGYDGPKHGYYGHHPVPVDVILEENELDGDEVEYCYLDGPHYHHYVPAASTPFVMKGGVYFFSGELPQVYVEAKPRLAKINVVYKPLRYARPVVVEAPPPEYRGPVVEVVAAPVEPVIVAPAPVRGEVHVGAPPVVQGHLEVNIPVPTVEVHVPGVVVEERVHVHEVKVKKHKHKHKGKHKKWKKGHW
jgi:hypothetical protein